ncbi:metallophosphoesterase [Sphingomicrobium aestuariivivum]|uniref:metallophosphoesterase n=1 Tax=Sphingomicrobium aestuariivivum TaxID=1582356 RepID=UPI001FD6F813|nr:metallophosphoesterase [Sphingomicrobium aestuariivivum]MCJ8192046.1 metallophosphoesterase [Sphingomicrobium aestuariivivum]
MLIAQLSDLHLAPDHDPVAGTNLARFDEALAAIDSLGRRPDLYLVTGDICEHGDVGSYARFLERMAALDTPWLATLGNHDRPEAYAEAIEGLPDRNRIGGPVARFDALAVVLADTSAAPQHGGWFDEERAARLDAALASCAPQPTLLALHHPPVRIGLDWLDPDPGADWIRHLRAAIAPHDHLLGIACGHVHVAATTRFEGRPVAICPSTAARAWPDLSPLDKERPDGRPLIVEGRPGFALHHLVDGKLATMFCDTREGAALYRFERPI